VRAWGTEGSYPVVHPSGTLDRPKARLSSPLYVRRASWSWISHTAPNISAISESISAAAFLHRKSQMSAVLSLYRRRRNLDRARREHAQGKAGLRALGLEKFSMFQKEKMREKHRPHLRQLCFDVRRGFSGSTRRCQNSEASFFFFFFLFSPFFCLSFYGTGGRAPAPRSKFPPLS